MASRKQQKQSKQAAPRASPSSGSAAQPAAATMAKSGCWKTALEIIGLVLGLLGLAGFIFFRSSATIDLVSTPPESIYEPLFQARNTSIQAMTNVEFLCGFNSGRG